MKYYLTYFIFFTILNLFAQDPQLFDYQWRLEKIVTAEETFIPSPEPDPNTGTFDYIWFYDETSSGFGYYFYFGVSGSVFGDNLIFSDTQSFEISDITVTLGDSSPASIFFADNYLYFDQNENIINNPFSYDFRYENELIYLDIINNEGSVATFYDTFLSQDEFLMQNLKVYPNPVKDQLYIYSPNIQVEQIVVYDLSGRVVLNPKKLKNNSLNLSPLNQGVYILKLKTNLGILQKQIIKE